MWQGERNVMCPESHLTTQQGYGPETLQASPSWLCSIHPVICISSSRILTHHGLCSFFFSSRTERPWDLNCWLNDKVLSVILVFRDFIFCFLTFKSWLRKVDTSLKDGSMCQTHGEAESETIRMTKKLVCFFQPPFYIRKISLLKLNYWRIGQADNISTTLKNINLLKTLRKSYLSCINIF